MNIIFKKFLFLQIILSISWTSWTSETVVETLLAPYDDQRIDVKGVAPQHQGILMSLIYPKGLKPLDKSPVLFLVHGTKEETTGLAHTLKDEYRCKTDSELKEIPREEFINAYRLRRDYLDFAQDLAAQGIMVVVPEPWGQRDMPRPYNRAYRPYSIHSKFKGYDFETAKRFIAAYSVQADMDNITALFHSSGWFNGMHALQNKPDLFHKIIYYAGITDIQTHDLYQALRLRADKNYSSAELIHQSIWKYLQEFMIAGNQLFYLNHDNNFHHSEMPGGIENYQPWTHKDHPFLNWDEMQDLNPQDFNEFPDKPYLLIQASDDRTVPIFEVAQMYNALKRQGRQVAFQLLAEGGHCIFKKFTEIESDPHMHYRPEVYQHFLSSVRNFCKGVFQLAPIEQASVDLKLNEVKEIDSYYKFSDDYRTLIKNRAAWISYLKNYNGTIDQIYEADNERDKMRGMDEQTLQDRVNQRKNAAQNTKLKLMSVIQALEKSGSLNHP